MISNNDFSDCEQEGLEELRKRMKCDMEPEMYEDIYLFYRFLKARDFNVDKAEAMLRKHLEWRQKKDIKNILKYKKPEVLEKYSPNIFLGYDKEGCVVRYSPIGNIDFIGISNSVPFEDLEKYMIFETEVDGYNLSKNSKELGRNVDKCVYIYNCEHLTFRTATNKTVAYNLIYMVNFLQDNYPERMKAAFVINSSRYLTILFSIMKKILAASILKKIHVYSDDRWKEDILKVVDADVLPAFLGGNRTDPDGNPLCLTFINHGALVPEKYFIRKRKKSLASVPGVKKITLARADFHKEILEVKESGSLLQWEFEAKGRDIGFSVYYAGILDDLNEMIQIIPFQRIDTEGYLETGTYNCEKGGKYVFVFDNPYSWLLSKEIYYIIKVLTPKEQEYLLDN